MIVYVDSTGDYNEYVMDFRRAVETFINDQITKSEKRTADEENGLTRVYPLLQMGLYDIAQDQTVLTSLFDSLGQNKDSGNSVSLASGYFNLDQQNEDRLLQMAHNSVPIEVLTSSPEVSRFCGLLVNCFCNVFTVRFFQYNDYSTIIPLTH